MSKKKHAPNTAKVTSPAPKKTAQPVRKKTAQTKIQPWLLVTIILVAVASVGAIALVLMNPDKAEAGRLPDFVSVQEAYTLYNQGAFVLDVRTQAEWDEYHIPNTTLIPLDQLQARLSELDPKRQIVVVCRSGNRSQEGRDILLQAGFNATSMNGGLIDWRASDYPVE